MAAHPSDPAARGLPQLPPGFRFGTSTAAYQVEGAAAEDGRGPSVWDTFSHTPGRTKDGHTGDVACDHYHRFHEDVALMKDLGVGGYRLSLSWSRIQPTGRGTPNARGLDFYDRLLDTLLAADVQPMVTLFHWDLPQALEDDGGWLNRATIDRFAEYAAIAGERFGDRVEHWVPVNEPNVVMMMGYGIGMHAPGRTLMFDSLPVAHHLLLAHGRAAIALRDSVPAGVTASVGCANNHAPMWPASDDAADVGATKLFDAMWNGLFIEPMLLGRYPVDIAPLLEDVVEDGDLATIRQPLDFYGVNYYNPMKIGAAAEDAELPFAFRELLGHPTTDVGWPVVPDALREWLIMFRARFRNALPPLYITENGAAYNMGPDADGVVDDQPRIDYIDAHLRAVATAVQRGVDVRGYYCWSLLDNFEWSEGYSQRFGLVHVDYETQARTPKRSYQWYADVIAAQTRSIG
ncbi:GH1 family beta-glucosidase [Nocardioides sp. Arc9.136]|uniref:GH1 family beta-glucosidase n=1 Tax=Nocardioides sp. Arc9.136 TaxID=2996826 RepID=UPI0026665D75|nr:GH1 family beta-glucosidase [Nocardioides sp. Arc9.136]WKN48417.1 GH1 family beta-glucosidase [Nocardioides sp. Arc9.136]